MTTTINAVYQDGVFRPEVPPDLPEGTTVQLWVLTPKRSRLVGEAALEHLRYVASKFDPLTDRPEVTSENVDEILYGKKGDPGDVR
jgi:predicted DNA-binding antitoxin AbrB/MazE fold protein